VILGLAWGIFAMIFLLIDSLFRNRIPDIDPALPEDSPYTKVAYTPKPRCCPFTGRPVEDGTCDFHPHAAASSHDADRAKESKYPDVD
jgi:hypothetical protein